MPRAVAARSTPSKDSESYRSSTKGVELDCGYRLDGVVADSLLIEIKAVERLLPIHEAQALTYLRLTGLPVAILVNFNVAVLRHGLRRLTYNPQHPFPPSHLHVNSFFQRPR
jgi:GxxExxY protein